MKTQPMYAGQYFGRWVDVEGNWSTKCYKGTFEEANHDVGPCFDEDLRTFFAPPGPSAVLGADVPESIA